MWQAKIVGLSVIFVYAFFRFTWSMRQYTFGALLIAAAPESAQFDALGLSRDAFAPELGIEDKTTNRARRARRHTGSGGGAGVFARAKSAHGPRLLAGMGHDKGQQVFASKHFLFD